MDKHLTPENTQAMLDITQSSIYLMGASFVLGSLFVLVTLLLPRGIVGTVRHYSGVWRERRDAADARAAEAAPKPAE